MYYVDDVAVLVDRGKIVPGEPARSPLLLRMLDGTMPPITSEFPAPPAEFLDRVSAFIESLCPDGSDGC